MCGHGTSIRMRFCLLWIKYHSDIMVAVYAASLPAAITAAITLILHRLGDNTKGSVYQVVLSQFQRVKDV